METIGIGLIVVFILFIYLGDKLKRNQDDIRELRDDVAMLQEQAGV